MSQPLTGPIPGAPHFTWRELTHSDIAQTYGLDNQPSPAQQERLAYLAVNLLEPLRQNFGPIIIQSGFRSGELNWFVSQSRHSRHCRGEAADLRPARPGVDPAQMIRFIHAELAFHELAVYLSRTPWMHLSCRLDGPPARKLLLQPPGRGLAPCGLGQMLIALKGHAVGQQADHGLRLSQT